MKFILIVEYHKNSLRGKRTPHTKRPRQQCRVSLFVESANTVVGSLHEGWSPLDARFDDQTGWTTGFIGLSITSPILAPGHQVFQSLT